jgi:hypothetical protein
MIKDATNVRGPQVPRAAVIPRSLRARAICPWVLSPLVRISQITGSRSSFLLAAVLLRATALAMFPLLPMIFMRKRFALKAAKVHAALCGTKGSYCAGRYRGFESLLFRHTFIRGHPETSKTTK